jgi:cystine transport system permease protein
VNFEPFIEAAGMTLVIASGGWLLSVVMGLLIAALRELDIPIIENTLGFFVTLIRATPELVLLYIVFFGIATIGISFDSVPAAIVALGISEGAFISEYFRAALLTVSGRQRSAASSLGMTMPQAFRYIVLPQAVPFAIPPLVNAFVGLLKTSALASAVGATELLYVGREQMALTGDIVQISLLIVIVYVVITVPLTFAAGQFEQRARSRLIV